MSGLDNIVKEIETEALAEAQAIKTMAEAEAEEILQDAKKTANEEVAKIEEATKRKIETIKDSNASAIEQQQRQSLLQAKQRLLNETLQEAMESLFTMPAKEYFDLCKRLVVLHAEEGEGVLFFCTDDLKRMPVDYGKELANALPAGKTIKISKDAKEIGGGFILQYGFVEQNCSFSALFAERREEFLDAVAPILFAE